MEASQRALALPEILQNVLNNVQSARNLHSCSRVNRTWCDLALELLYEGSLLDQQF
ncbi:hypothetical protein BDV19DRAFT_363778 [Aspergillus venezuelensis]